MTDYPPYGVKLEVPGASHKMTGTHAGSLVTSAPKFKIKFELEHGDKSTLVPGKEVPNLILKLVEIVPE